MLLVTVRLDRSPNHGWGIFAVDPIPVETPVWRFTPGFDLDLDPKRLDEQPPGFRQVLLHYGYVDPRLNRFILCCDDYRFLNHSETPNLCVEMGTDRYGIDVAARAIDAGEELTIDYGTVEGFRPDTRQTG